MCFVFLVPFHNSIDFKRPSNSGDRTAYFFIKIWTLFDVSGHKFKGQSQNKFRMHVFWVIYVEI